MLEIILTLELVIVILGGSIFNLYYEYADKYR